MWYNIDFRLLSLKLLPTFLREKVMVNWLGVLVSPLEVTHKEFLENRNENIIKTTHNSQVCYLRKILNDTFNPDRKIDILEGNSKLPLYIYTNPEKKPKFLGTKFIYGNVDLSDKGVDFIVQIPSELEKYKMEISAKTSYYKLASKRFIIQIKD